MSRWFSGSCVALGLLAILLGNAPEVAIGKDKKAEPKKAPEVPPREGKSETIHLFNGKDLEGWEGYTDLWSVKDGAIVGRNDKPLKVSTYLFTKRKFTDFRLVFSAKLDKINSMHSGVAIWGSRITAPDKGLDAAKEHGEYTYRGHLVMFPTGWGLFDLYRRGGAINPPQAIRDVAIKAGKQNDWNDMEILAQGNRIRLVVNGKLALDWRDPEPKYVAEGPIALQLHSEKKPQEVSFKGLVVTTFPENKLITEK
ncbi:MAG: DUF1080 domain-containing protein [Planctomycetes bacterium]|nr:DUF1080 domain-containing protein [Planctomycetota bacterium]